MPSMSIARWLTGEKIRTEFGNPMVAGTPARGIVAHRRGVSNLRALDRGILCDRMLAVFAPIV